MLFDTLILDLDGPLLEGRERHYRCYSDILVELGKIPVPIEEYWALKRARVNRKELLNRSDARAHCEIFLSAWLDRIEQQAYLALDRLQPCVLEILDMWRGQGRRLILATQRQSDKCLSVQLATLQLRQRLDQVIQVGLEQNGKARKVRELVRDLESERTLWVGDTEMDHAAAREIGCALALVNCGLRAPEFLASLKPEYQTNSLSDLVPLLEDD